MEYLPDSLGSLQPIDALTPVTGHDILIQSLQLFQLVFENLSFGHPLNGNPQEFVFCVRMVD
jgi:hypothetical protein